MPQVLDLVMLRHAIIIFLTKQIFVLILECFNLLLLML